MLSPARVDSHIVQEIKQFIEQWGKVVERKRILESNLVVFDKTVAGYPTKLSKVVEFRDIGAVRVCRAREKRLCVQILFFKQRLPHPVHCHHLQRKNRKWCKKNFMVLRHPEAHCQRNQPQRRYFITQTGFLNEDVFSVIINEFF